MGFCDGTTRVFCLYRRSCSRNRHSKENFITPSSIHAQEYSTNMQALRRIDVNNAGTDKNRTVRPRTASKDAMMGSPTKTARRVGDTPTVRNVSRSIKSSENAIRTPEKRYSSPSKSPEKSTLGRKFATTVMQPAFEQASQISLPLLIVATTAIEKVSCRGRGPVTTRKDLGKARQIRIRCPPPPHPSSDFPDLTVPPNAPTQLIAVILK